MQRMAGNVKAESFLFVRKLFLFHKIFGTCNFRKSGSYLTEIKKRCLSGVAFFASDIFQNMVQLLDQLFSWNVEAIHSTGFNQALHNAFVYRARIDTLIKLF